MNQPRNRAHRASRMLPRALAALCAAAALALFAAQTFAQSGAASEAALRRNLAQRLPQLARIDEVSPSPIPGLFEIRIGTDLFYTDAEGNYLIEGQIIETRTRRNLTEQRQEKLSAVDFAALPFKDSFTIVRGNGKRRAAIFEDPNCGYCKRMERDLMKVDNVTIHIFLVPILGPDSMVKSRQIWCSADKARTWQDWMVNGRVPMGGMCDTSALERNVEFSKKYRIAGTPTTFFADGTRMPGAVTAAQFEKMLSEAK